MTDKPKMKPCPFCAEAAKLSSWPEIIDDTIMNDCYVCCEHCHATGPVAPTGEEVEAWNRAPCEEVISPTLYWNHVPASGDEEGWDAVECRPDHPLQPRLRVVRENVLNDGAIVSITCRERDGDEEVTIAEVNVPWRDDLADCSICKGEGSVMVGGEFFEICEWCGGKGNTAMDEGKEIACALYWSWLRSSDPGGGKVQ